MDLPALLERIETDRQNKLSGAGLTRAQPDPAHTSALIEPSGDILLCTLGDQAQQLSELFRVFSTRALNAKDPKAGAAALSAAVKAQQAGVRSMIAIAGLLAQRQGHAKVVLRDDE